MKKFCYVTLALLICLVFVSCSDHTNCAVCQELIKNGAVPVVINGSLGENDAEVSGETTAPMETEAPIETTAPMETEAEPSTPEEPETQTMTADMVRLMISSMGRVTTESGDAIKAVRDAYESLPDGEKMFVANLEDLIQAEYNYDFISKERANGFKTLLRVTGFKAERVGIGSDVMRIQIGFQNLNEKTIDEFVFLVQAYDANGNLVTSGIHERTSFRETDDYRYYKYNYDPNNRYSYLHEHELDDSYWTCYYPTTAVTFKVVRIDINYADGTQITLTADQCAQVSY